MKRVLCAMLIAGLLLGSVHAASADDWRYHAAGYPAPAQRHNHDTLKKIAIGGALIGLGFLAGRLTAPKPYDGPVYAPAPHYPPAYGPAMHSYGPRTVHRHRF